jgi:hypothetical protein
MIPRPWECLKENQNSSKTYIADLTVFKHSQGKIRELHTVFFILQIFSTFMLPDVSF